VGRANAKKQAAQQAHQPDCSGQTDDDSHPCQLHPLAQNQTDCVAPLRAQR
jgi:hypothetical protein